MKELEEGYGQRTTGVDQSHIYELWTIVTYAYGGYEETLDALAGDTIEEPQRSFQAWPDDDMVDCAKAWCRTALVGQRLGKHHGPLTAADFAQLAEIDHDTESLWNSFKIEFSLLTCTKDRKYEDLRAQIAKLTGQKSQLAITSAIAAGLANCMGVTISTILTLLCAICLLATFKIGKELLCKRLAQPGFQEIGVKLGKRPTQ